MLVCPPNGSRDRHDTRRAGFTLIELLVVIAVIAVLAMLAFGSFQSAMRSSKTAGSLSNMRQLTGALLNFAADNNNMLPGLRDPQTGAQGYYSYDLQIFPYLGISAGYSGSPADPQIKPGLNLEVFRCPLDQRKTSSAGYPRSYGITATTVCMTLSPQHTGRIPGRPLGEGMRLSRLRSPAKFVVLCRYGKDWEDETIFSRVGARPRSVNDGPEANDVKRWDAYHSEFGKKTPYGFADGHIALMTREESLAIYPFRYDVNK